MKKQVEGRMKSPFLSAITEKMRMRYYAEKRLKLIDTGLNCISFFCNKKHPSKCHHKGVESYLSYLANERRA